MACPGRLHFFIHKIDLYCLRAVSRKAGRLPWSGRHRELGAHGCWAASVSERKVCDDAEVLAVALCRGQEGRAGSEGQAHGQSSVLLLPHTCVLGAKRGARLFPSQLAGPPQSAAPSHQETEWARLPADGTGALAAPSFPPGREQTGAGLRYCTPEQSASPAPEPRKDKLQVQARAALPWAPGCGTRGLPAASSLAQWSSLWLPNMSF